MKARWRTDRCFAVPAVPAVLAALLTGPGCAAPDATPAPAARATVPLVATDRSSPTEAAAPAAGATPGRAAPTTAAGESPSPPRPLVAAPTTHTRVVDGATRRFELYRPDGAAAGAARPLVVVLHGFGGSGRQVLAQGRWLAQADAAGFVVAAPDGSTERDDMPAGAPANPRTWNAGAATGSPASRRGVDDVAFLRALLDELSRDGGVDARRVFVTGFSNGAAMAFRVAAELPGRIAAIAPVASALLVPLPPVLAPPVSLLLVWGDADPVNPIEGRTVVRGGRRVARPSALESWQRWSRALRCDGAPVRRTPAPGVTEQAHARCADGSVAEFVVVAGLGHRWPGGEGALRAVAGPGSDTLDATDRIWAFFRAHGR